MSQTPRVAKWRQRIFVFEAIYTDLIHQTSSKDIIKNVYGMDNWSDFETLIFNNYLENKEKYLEEISQLLNENWTIDRLNIPLLALILEAISEYFTIGTPSNVLIEQSVLTSKKYCDDNEYKFANALLDNYLKRKCQT